MERSLQRYSAETASQVMQKLTLQAVNRAPYTVFGTIFGVIIGAIFDGPRGALIGAGIGSGIGYAVDCSNKPKH